MDGLGQGVLAAPAGAGPLAALDDLLPEAPVEEVVTLEIECPACGSPDTAVQRVEDAEVTKCKRCGCEFCPTSMFESSTKHVLTAMSATRRKRFESLGAVDLRESLPACTSGHAFLFLDQP